MYSAYYFVFFAYQLKTVLKAIPLDTLHALSSLITQIVAALNFHFIAVHFKTVIVVGVLMKINIALSGVNVREDAVTHRYIIGKTKQVLKNVKAI